MQSLETKSLRLKSFEIEMIPETFETETPKNGSRAKVGGVTFSDSDSAPVPKFLNPCPDLGPEIFQI